MQTVPIQYCHIFFFIIIILSQTKILKTTHAQTETDYATEHTERTAYCSQTEIYMSKPHLPTTKPQFKANLSKLFYSLSDNCLLMNKVCPIRKRI